MITLCSNYNRGDSHSQDAANGSMDGSNGSTSPSTASDDCPDLTLDGQSSKSDGSNNGTELSSSRHSNRNHKLPACICPPPKVMNDLDKMFNMTLVEISVKPVPPSAELLKAASICNKCKKEIMENRTDTYIRADSEDAPAVHRMTGYLMMATKTGSH